MALNNLLPSLIATVLKPLLRKLVADKIEPGHIKSALDSLYNKYVTTERIADLMDKGIDKLEDMAEKSDNKYDDQLVAFIRKASTVKDND